MQRIASKDEMYLADKQTINDLGIPGFTLMESAGGTIARELIKNLNPRSRAIVLCGNGNNGGDGLVIGRYLLSHRINTSVYLVPDVKELTGDAKAHYDVFCRFGYSVIPVKNISDKVLKEADIIVDALLGIGMKGELREPYDSLISAINASPAKVVSVDLPSGVYADGGKALNAVKADETYTIAFPKPASYQYPEAECFGKIHTVDIGIPQSCLPQNGIATWELEDFKSSFPKRRKNAHKGDCGKGLIIGGSRQYQGAPLICANGCLKCGIGLLTLAVPQELKKAATLLCPEATYLPCTENDGFLEKLEIPDSFSVIAVGMGLSRNPSGRSVLREVLAKEIPVVIDADGLYFLKEEMDMLKKRKAPTILTPHEGEMARLCGVSTEEISGNRFEISKNFAVSMGVTLVLKGPNTIVTTSHGEQFVNITGNPGLAKGGSGDLLTGMIAAFIPTHKTIQEAVSNAVFLHGLAADYLKNEKGISYLSISASAITEVLPELLDNLEKGDF